MTISKTKFLTACAASALLAVALSACGGGGGGGGPATDGGATTPEPDPKALANVIDLVANDARQNDQGEYIGGSWWHAPGIGAQQATVSGRHEDGRWVTAIISHDDNDQLHHNIAGDS